jgi:UDP-3-O-[3-hydroxymyristoyl] glucosamine N-acyltransferase
VKLEQAITLEQAAAILGCNFVGDPSHLITGINEIHMVEPGDLVFVDHPKYYDKALKSKATTVLIDQLVDCPEGKGLLISTQPFDDFNLLIRKFRPFKPWNGVKGENVTIDENTLIQPNVTLGNNITIGKNCIIHSGVVVHDNVHIGDEVIIQANSVIGSSAFYYKKKSTGFDRLHTCGRVIIQNRVEIGALCTIDAGVTGDTTIGAGTKIDNQVHIGHDTVVGNNCLFAAQVGIAGCVRIGNNVTLWGQVGLASDMTIGDNAVLLGQSGASKDLEGGKTYFGSPVDEARTKFREVAALKKLPFIIENMD